MYEINDTIRNDRLAAFITGINSGTGVGKVLFVDTTSGGAPITLGTLNFDAIPFGTPAAGSMTMTPIPAGVVGTSGPLGALWIVNGDDVVQMKLSVGLAGSGKDVIVASTTMTGGQALSIAVAVFTESAGVA